MHSRIFQISTEPIDKENYLNEDTLQQGDGSFYDYCSEIDEEDRKEDIANLVNHALPKGMFELISDDTMRYNGGIEQWKEEYVANIKKRADALTVDNMLEWGSTYYLKQAVENPLDVAYHFYLDGDGCSLLPNSPLRLWSLFVGLNRERYSTSEELLITTSDVCPKHWQPPASKVGGCSLFCTGSPITFITYSAEFPPSASLPVYSCFKGIIPSQPRHTPQICFRVQRYGGRTWFKYRYRYLK